MLLPPEVKGCFAAAVGSSSASVAVSSVSAVALEAFQHAFLVPATASMLEAYVQSHSNATQTLNFYLRYRYEAMVKATVVQWVKAEYTRNVFGQSTQGKWITLLRWNEIYRAQCLQALRDVMRDKVTELCESGFDEPVAKELQAWMRMRLLPFACALCASSGGEALLGSDLRRTATVMFVEVRTMKLFEIIADFPDSLIAVSELRDHLSCSSQPGVGDASAFDSQHGTGGICHVSQAQAAQLLGRVGKGLRRTIEARLLHLGATTAQILDFYVSMIAALRILDNSDALLNYALIPVRAYLKQRKDAIRCIISSLTESKGSDLHSALRSGMSLAYGIDDDDEEQGPGVNWNPKARNADLKNAGQRGLDVLASLVSIYGSTDLFVAEFRQVLAERLLHNLHYGMDEELTNVELLKIRFGEECLHCCEVMLKDLQDSKRANTSVHSAWRARGEADACVVDLAIVSEHYWPSIPRDTVTHHASAQALLDAYTSTFAVLKKPRKLQVLPQLGTVELELAFNDGAVRTFTVSPVQATLISHMAEQDDGKATTLAELATLCELDESDVVAAMRVWVTKGVVREVVSMAQDEYDDEVEYRTYTIVEEQTGCEEVEDGDGADADQADRLEALQQARCESTRVLVAGYVKGLLASNGAMGVDRVFSLLQLVLMANNSISAADYAFASSIASLRQFLNSLVDQGVLEVVDGLFALARSVV